MWTLKVESINTTRLWIEMSLKQRQWFQAIFACKSSSSSPLIAKAVRHT